MTKPMVAESMPVPEEVVNFNREDFVSINKHQLRDMIDAVLKYLEPEIPYSAEARELLMMTAAIESNLGDYVRQHGGGPARGIFQVEKLTENDVHRWLGRPVNAKLKEKIHKLAGDPPPGIDPAQFDLDYQIALARCFYRMKPEALPTVKMVEDRPDYDSIVRMARYYKKWFNTYLGASTEKKAIDKYCKYAV